MDPVRKLILDKADQHGGLSALSKAIGRNHAYLQQFVSRSVPASLPEDARGALAELLGVPEDMLRGPGRPTGRPVPSAQDRPRAASPPVDPGPIMLPGKDFPVYASAEGGPGEIIRSTDPVDWVPRPAPVASVRGAYGLLITGESMFPEYQAGETAIVDPNLPVVGAAVYVFYAERDGEARATIKHLRRAAGDSWHVKQWNPPDGAKADFTLSRKEWAKAHRVLGKYSRR